MYKIIEAYMEDCVDGFQSVIDCEMYSDSYGSGMRVEFRVDEQILVTPQVVCVPYIELLEFMWRKSND